MYHTSSGLHPSDQQEPAAEGEKGGRREGREGGSSHTGMSADCTSSGQEIGGNIARAGLVIRAAKFASDTTASLIAG